LILTASSLPFMTGISKSVMTESPSEAFDRQEIVLLLGEMVGSSEPRVLPIIRTDAGGFFGFGERDSSLLHKFQGRFAQMLPPKRPTAKGREAARALLAAMGITEEHLRGDAGRN
jgi:hypothetical protein